MGTYNLLKNSEKNALHIGGLFHLNQQTGYLHSGTRLPDGVLTYAWYYQYKYNGKYLLPWHVTFGTGAQVRYMFTPSFGLVGRVIYYGLFEDTAAASVARPLELFGGFDKTGAGGSSTIYYSPNKHLPTVITNKTGLGEGEATASGAQGFAYWLGVNFSF